MFVVYQLDYIKNNNGLNELEDLNYLNIFLSNRLIAKEKKVYVETPGRIHQIRKSCLKANVPTDSSFLCLIVCFIKVHPVGEKT